MFYGKKNVSMAVTSKSRYCHGNCLSPLTLSIVYGLFHLCLFFSVLPTIHLPCHNSIPLIYIVFLKTDSDWVMGSYEGVKVELTHTSVHTHIHI